MKNLQLFKFGACIVLLSTCLNLSFAQSEGEKIQNSSELAKFTLVEPETKTYQSPYTLKISGTGEPGYKVKYSCVSGIYKNKDCEGIPKIVNINQDGKWQIAEPIILKSTDSTIGLFTVGAIEYKPDEVTQVKGATILRVFGVSSGAYPLSINNGPKYTETAPYHLIADGVGKPGYIIHYSVMVYRGNPADCSDCGKYYLTSPIVQTSKWPAEGKWHTDKSLYINLPVNTCYIFHAKQYTPNGVFTGGETSRAFAVMSNGTNGNACQYNSNG